VRLADSPQVGGELLKVIRPVREVPVHHFQQRHVRHGRQLLLAERICRENGITQRLTRPRSPTTTGKIERLHQTLQQELLNVHGAFASIEDALDAWRKEYNTTRPHQSLDMAFPSARFTRAAPRGPGPAGTGRAHADGQACTAWRGGSGRRCQAVTRRCAGWP
jgi:hypothetical protein